jgi:hypothetical protein
MKAKIILLLLSATLLSAFAQQQKHGKYFFTKSGHIEYELTGSTTGKKNIWFDDFGIKTATLYESKSTIKILGITKTIITKELEIRNGNYLWKIDLLKKSGTKTTINYAIETGKSITNGKTDAQLHQTERKVITDMGGKIEGYENILGRKCLVFKFGTTKFWQYKGIPLKSDINLNGLITNYETATSFDENINVPSSKFDIPAGITIDEGVNPIDEGGGIGGLLNALDKNMKAGDDENAESNDEEDEPLRTNLTYNEFLNALKNVKVNGFKKTVGEKSKSAYMSFFTVNGLNGGISIMNLELFDNAEKGEDIDVQKTYKLDGKSAKYVYTREGDTEMHALFIKYPAKKMTLIIHAERSLPLSTIEEIARQLNF